MRTARSGPDFSRRLAAHLGDEWRAHPVGCADRAILQGPGDLELDVWISRTDKRAVVEARANASLVWADPTDYWGRLEGSLTDPAAMATRIRTEMVPARRALDEVLTGRTEVARAALDDFLAEAVRIVGPNARIEYGSRPAMASLRWDGGAAHLHADGHGRIRAAALTMKEIDGAATLRVLAAGPGATPRPDTPHATGHATAVPPAPTTTGTIP